MSTTERFERVAIQAFWSPFLLLQRVLDLALVRGAGVGGCFAHRYLLDGHLCPGTDLTVRCSESSKSMSHSSHRTFLPTSRRPSSRSCSSSLPLRSSSPVPVVVAPVMLPRTTRPLPPLATVPAARDEMHRGIVNQPPCRASAHGNVHPARSYKKITYPPQMSQ